MKKYAADKIKITLGPPWPKWTTKKPNVPGWYWATDSKGEVWMCKVVDDEERGLVAVVPGLPQSLECFAKWCGPINQPDAPV